MSELKGLKSPGKDRRHEIKDKLLKHVQSCLETGIWDYFELNIARHDDKDTSLANNIAAGVADDFVIDVHSEYSHIKNINKVTRAIFEIENLIKLREQEPELDEYLTDEYIWNIAKAEANTFRETGEGLKLLKQIIGFREKGAYLFVKMTPQQIMDLVMLKAYSPLEYEKSWGEYVISCAPQVGQYNPRETREETVENIA